MRLQGNFDKDGNLQRLHLDAVEECNLDDADSVRTLTWVGALQEVGSAINDAIERERTRRKEVDFLTAKEFKEKVDGWYRNLLCQHCGFSEGDTLKNRHLPEHLRKQIEKYVEDSKR